MMKIRVKKIVKGKITTIPRNIDYIEYATKLEDTGVMVLEGIIDQYGHQVPSDNYYYPTETRREQLEMIRLQDSSISSIGNPDTDAPFNKFVMEVDDEFQKMINKGINIYIHAQEEVKIRINTGNVAKTTTYSFYYMLEPSQMYQYYFMDGVSKESINRAGMQAMINVNKKIEETYDRVRYM